MHIVLNIDSHNKYTHASQSHLCLAIFVFSDTDHNTRDLPNTSRWNRMAASEHAFMDTKPCQYMFDSTASTSAQPYQVSIFQGQGYRIGFFILHVQINIQIPARLISTTRTRTLCAAHVFVQPSQIYPQTRVQTSFASTIVYQSSHALNSPHEPATWYTYPRMFTVTRSSAFRNARVLHSQCHRHST